MSRGLDTWYSLPDLDNLARRKKPLAGEIELVRLPRLSALLGQDQGTVGAQLRVEARTDGRLQLSLSYTADVELTCQRCLEPLYQTLSGSVEYLLAENGSAQAEPAASSSDGIEAAVEMLQLTGERLNPRELIEDELLVALPYSPRHEKKDDCGALLRTLEKLTDDTGGGLNR